MNILILGSGGREHAFAHYLSKSKNCEQLFIAPGNAGTASCGKNLAIAVGDFEAIKEAIKSNKIDLVLVGPEAPLVDGVRDFLLADEELKNLLIVGPGKEGAQLEGSKAFSKAFMNRQNIPCAKSLDITSDNLEEGKQHIQNSTGPFVLKADGLAAGKGVLIINDKDEAIQELENMLGGKFGAAGSKVLIEDFLDGIEFSVFALFDGKDYVLLPSAKDYKRIGEGDTGLNTGGMGAVSPVPFVTSELMNKVESQIVIPTFDGLKKEGIDYCGFVFFGLIRVGNDPFVIEYNARMGDPETESVLARVKNDLVDVLAKTGKGELASLSIDFDTRTALTTVLASGGYPEAYEKGKEIAVDTLAKTAILFHAGTKKEGERLLTNGGRVMALTCLGDDIPDCQQKSAEARKKIAFDGMYFRTDIGNDLV